MADLRSSLSAMAPSDRSALGQRWAGIADTPLLILSLAYIGVLLTPYLVRVDSAQSRAIEWTDWSMWVIFGADYAFRLWAAESRWQFVRTHKLDLAVVLLPFLRPLRAFRALRLVRVLSLVGLSQGHAKRSTHVQVSLYAALTSLTAILVAAIGISWVESSARAANIKGIGDGLWWAATTITTVGYGDHYPVTTGGRIIAVALMVTGIAMLGVVTASIAAWFVDRLQTVTDAEEKTQATLDDVLAELAELKVELQRVTAASGSATP